MRHIGEFIKIHVEINELKKKDIAAAVGISPTYLSGIFKESSIDCALFEKICHVIGLSPALVFDAPVSGSQIRSDIKNAAQLIPSTAAESEIKLLKELLAEKERLIQILITTSGINLGTDSERLPLNNNSK